MTLVSIHIIIRIEPPGGGISIGGRTRCSTHTKKKNTRKKSIQISVAAELEKGVKTKKMGEKKMVIKMTITLAFGSGNGHLYHISVIEFTIS